MLVIDNGDAIRGIAEVATQLDFIVNGYVGTTATQLADGQLGTAEADLYLSGADATVVTSITVVNRDSAARTFTLYLKPSAGTSRAISPVSLDLGIGHSFYTDGQRVVVLDKSGNVLSTATVLSHTLGGSSHDADTLSNLNSKISDATLVDTGDIILKAFLTTQNDIITRNGSNPIRLNIAASRMVARLATGDLVGATPAEIATLIQSSIKLDNLGTPDDNTDLDFGTARHGLVPKGLNAGDFLKDDGSWDAVAAGDMPLEVPKPNIIRWVIPGWQGTKDPTGVVPGNGVIVYIPIFVSKTTTYIRIAITVDAAQSGNADLRIFAWDSGLPGALILSAGTVSTSSNGIKEITISQELTSGYYFLAVRCDSTVKLNGIVAQFGIAPVSGLNTSAASNISFVVFNVTAAYTDPAPAPTSAASCLSAFVILREN